MNKKTRTILLVILALVLVGEVAFLAVTKLDLFGPAEVTEPPTEAPTEAPTEKPTEPPTEPPTEAPTEPPVLYRNPLTGEPAQEPLTGRIMVTSINNHKKAMPQEGISQADIYYEMLVEGSVTRCLGVFSNIEAVEKLGPIRSARIYTLGLARSYDAILVHAGGSEESDNAVQKLGWPHIDGVRGSGADAFYRDQDRRKAGYSLEHTMFTSGELLVKNAVRRELELTHEAYDFGLTFAEEGTGEAGDTCEKLTVAFGTGRLAKTTTMNYNKETGKYNGFQFDEDWIDGLTKEVLAFENVLVLHANTYTQSDGEHKTIELVGEGTGLFANGGRIIPIKWSHESWDAPFVYTMEDGSPLTLGMGKSYIALVPLKADISYE